jgi:hypothetical protein
MIPTKSDRNQAKSRRILAKSSKLFFSLSFFFFFFLNLCKPKLIGEELLGREHGVGEEGSLDFDQFFRFAEIQQDFAGLTVDGSPESLLRVFWKKKSKMPELKEIKTLEGSIEKIEILVVELKIAANFEEGK